MPLADVDHGRRKSLEYATGMTHRSRPGQTTVPLRVLL